MEPASPSCLDAWFMVNWCEQCQIAHHYEQLQLQSGLNNRSKRYFEHVLYLAIAVPEAA